MSQKNPYAGATVLKNGSPIEGLKFGTSNSHALDERTGEINAWDKKDAMRSISEMMAMANRGELVQRSTSLSAKQRAEELATRQEVLSAALVDPALWTALGASMATQIEEQRDRQGFMRRVLVGNSIKQGDVARITMETHDATAIVATSSANVAHQIIRTNGGAIPVSEFEIIANLRVENIDLQQVGGDLLDRCYNQGVQATMVAEDRLVKKAFDESVGIRNAITYIAGNLTPQVLATLQQQVSGWGLPAVAALIANDYWADISGDAAFGQFLDPITKYDLVLNGRISMLGGMELITDAFRNVNQKVLNKGEIYVLTSPENLGGYTDRGGITAVPTSGSDAGNTTRGWMLSEVLGLMVANAKGVAVAKRV
jgi:hypothetical protein